MKVLLSISCSPLDAYVIVRDTDFTDYFLLFSSLISALAGAI